MLPSRAITFSSVVVIVALCALGGCRKSASSNAQSADGKRLLGTWEKVMGDDAGMMKVEFTPAGNLLVSVYRPASSGSPGGPMQWASEPHPAGFDTETGRWKASGSILTVDDDGKWDYAAEFPLEFLSADEIILGSKQGWYPGRYLHKLSGKWRRAAADGDDTQLTRLLAIRDRLSQAIRGRQTRKDALLESIRQMEAGPRTTEAADTRRVYAQELYLLVGECRAIQGTLDRVDAAIIRLRSSERMAEGRSELEKLPLSEDDRSRLFSQIAELDEELKSRTGTANVTDAELDAVVEAARRNRQ